MGLKVSKSLDHLCEQEFIIPDLGNCQNEYYERQQTLELEQTSTLPITFLWRSALCMYCNHFSKTMLKLSTNFFFLNSENPLYFSRKKWVTSSDRKQPSRTLQLVLDKIMRI